MAGQLRWILAALSALLLAAIWWWGTRRSRQGPGNAELREVTNPMAPPLSRAQGAVEDASAAPLSARAHAGDRDWGVPPFEPLNIRTAEFDAIQIVDLPMRADGEALDEPLEVHTEPPAAPIEEPFPSVDASSPLINEPRAPQAPRGAQSAAAHTPNATETQHIVTVRVSAVGESRWSGPELAAALEHHGMAFGRYSVFHRRHRDGRTLFCAASLVEPGTFNMALMPRQEFRGLTMFAVLPGPADPLETLEALIETARQLAETLKGVVQDSAGAALSPQRADALRDDVARFQALLSMT